MGVLYIMDTVGCGQFPFQFRFLCVFLPHGRIAHEKLKLTGGRAGVRACAAAAAACDGLSGDHTVPI